MPRAGTSAGEGTPVPPGRRHQPPRSAPPWRELDRRGPRRPPELKRMPRRFALQRSFGGRKSSPRGAGLTGAGPGVPHRSLLREALMESHPLAQAALVGAARRRGRRLRPSVGSPPAPRPPCRNRRSFLRPLLRCGPSRSPRCLHLPCPHLGPRRPPPGPSLRSAPDLSPRPPLRMRLLSRRRPPRLQLSPFQQRQPRLLPCPPRVRGPA